MDTIKTNPDNRVTGVSEIEGVCAALNHLIGDESFINEEELRFYLENDTAFSNLFTQRSSLADVKEYLLEKKGRGNLPVKQVEISTHELIGDVFKSFWTWASIGFGLVDDNKYKARLAVCNLCEKYIDAPDEHIYLLAGKLTKAKKVCAVCGCFMKNKARLASSECPQLHNTIPGVSKWGEPIQ